MNQAGFLRQAIEQLEKQRGGLNEAYFKEAQEIDAAIESLILASNNGPQIVGLRLKKEEVRRNLTARAANIQGQVQAYTELFNRYHQNPVPPGTILHGLDVSTLDWETRAKVMAGDVDTITALGGRLTEPAPAEPAPAEPAPAEPKIEGAAGTRTRRTK